MQGCTPMILSFTLLWDKAIFLQHYKILRFVSKISCPALTCLNVTQRRLKSFTSPRFFPPDEPVASIKVGDCSIYLSNEVKDLGVTLDRHLTFKTHINNICSASSSIHQIGKIRNLLSRTTTERLIKNWILQQHSLRPTLLRAKEITAIRLTVRAKQSAHITTILKSLHWLPLKERINFRILLVTYKILHGFAPTYLNELLFNYTPHRLIRLSSLNLLSIPKTRTVTYGERSVSVIAPKLWNELPITIKQCSTVDSFKSRLKTFLFNRVYC